MRPAPESSSRQLMLATGLVALLIVVALLAPWLAPYAPHAQPDSVGMQSLPPSLDHPIGTDAYSRDVLSRVIFGARVSLSVASLSVLIALSLGTAYGALAAFVGQRMETLLLRLLDMLLALPRLLVLLAVTAFWGALPIPALALLLGLTGWYDIARLVHGETRALSGRDFIAAAHATGMSRARVFVRHMLPHLVPLLTVAASLGIAATIALEAGLSYLGLGVQEPTASWGSIMREGIGVVDTQWWLTVFPGLATVVAVLACNALGEGLRDLSTHRQVDA